MLRKFPENEIDRYIDPAYELALDQTRSCYPTYADGIKTKEQFVTSLREAVSGENDKVYLYERDGKVEGFIQFYTLPEDKYLQLVMFSIRSGMEQAFGELTDLLKAEYSGYEWYFGFPACNEDAISCLKKAENGFELLESSFNDVIRLKDRENTPQDDRVITVTEENFDRFRRLHTWSEDEMYWTADRIFESIHKWNIRLFMRNGVPEGAVWFTPEEDGCSEIFGLDYRDGCFDREVCSALIGRALNDSKARGIRHVIFFAEEKEQEAALACGFRCVGQYVCYKRAADEGTGA